jgi:hypothetical protein
VTSKAIAGIAVTAVLAGGAVEAKKVAMPAPVKPAVVHVAAPAPTPAATAEPTGGISLADVPPSLVEKPKPTAEAGAARQKPADEAGTTGPEGVGTTGSGVVTDPSQTSNGSAPGVEGQQKSPPASGSTTGPDTGGATAPPQGTKTTPAPPLSGSGSPARPPAGATGP